MLHEKRKFAPPPPPPGLDLVGLVDGYFNAYNAARLRDACRLLVQVLDSGALVALSLSGALTPAGLGSTLAELVRRGMIDYVSSTGANLYHDLHFALGLPMYAGGAEVASGAADRELRERGIVRVYDVLFPASTLYETDEWVYRTLLGEEFRKRMGTSELHHLLGRHALIEAERHGVTPGLLATCHQLDVPVFAPSPGDSTLGMNIAALWAAAPELAPQIDPSIDVTQMAGLVLDAKRSGSKSAVLILGGGAPKNFVMQTEPQIQEILGIAEKGHDYFIQVTDARPDTGGLSGATPSEAVSWGKIDPSQLPNCVVCYLDSTVALPLLAAYAMARARPRVPGRLYQRLGRVVETLRHEYRGSEMYRRYFGG